MVETLIYLAGVFLVGGLFVLERRCLGQMAVVQPLVVCLGAAWLVGNEAVGLWFGVSLQLFSVTLVRRVDWALAGTVAALTILTAPVLGIKLVVGEPGTLALVLIAVLVGAGARSIELGYARRDGATSREAPPWSADDPARAIESVVYRAVLRSVLLGGLQATIGTGLALLAASAFGQWHHLPGTQFLTGAALPTFGAALAVSTLADCRAPLWTGLSAAVALAVFA